MDLTILAVVFLTLSCSLVPADAQYYNSAITVSNGEQWDTWGKVQFCPWGTYAKGFSLKVKGSGGDTALSGIRLHCTDGSTITSKVGLGSWTKHQSCPRGHLFSFSVNVQAVRGGGQANKFKFICNDGTQLRQSYPHNGRGKGSFGPASGSCSSFICGIQTQVGGFKIRGADKALSGVKLFCCS